MNAIDTIKKAQKELETKVAKRFDELIKTQNDTEKELKEIVNLAQANGIKLGKIPGKKKSTKKTIKKTNGEPSSKDLILKFIQDAETPPYISQIQEHIEGFGYSKAGVPVTVNSLVKSGEIKKDVSEGPKKTRFIAG